MGRDVRCDCFVDELISIGHRSTPFSCAFRRWIMHPFRWSSAPVSVCQSAVRAIRPTRYDPEIDYRSLGSTGVQVSHLCLGAMMFGDWGNPDHDDSVRIIHRALDEGINFIDTADVYTRGRLRGDRRQGARQRAGCATRSCSRRKCMPKWARAEIARATRAVDHRRVRGKSSQARNGLHRPVSDPSTGPKGCDR